MVHTFVDSALEDLSTLIRYPEFSEALEAQSEAFQVDLRFVQMFLRCLISLDPDNDNDRMLISSMHSSLKGLWDNSGDGLFTAGNKAMKNKLQVWNKVSTKLGDRIQKCKRQVKEYCVEFMSTAVQSKPFPGDQTLEFLDEMIKNSNNLVLHLTDAEEILQIETITRKILSLRHVVEFVARRCPDDAKEFTDFMIHVLTWANKTACLTCLYWAAAEGDSEGSRMNLWIADLLRKGNPCTDPEFIHMCFAAMKSSGARNFLYNDFVTSFVDFLLETAADMKDDKEIFREECIWLISYLTVPPKDHYALTFRPETLLLGDAASLSGAVDKAIIQLSRIRNFRGEIEEVHDVRIPDFILPRTDKIGFVDSLLRKVEHVTTTMESNPKIAPFAKHVLRVKDGLRFLSSSIHFIWEKLFQGKDQELKDVLDRMMDVAYEAELAVNSCFTFDRPIWHHLSCFSQVQGKINDIRNEFEMLKLNANQMYRISASKPPSIYMPPHLELKDEIVVGFRDAEQALTDRITWGPETREIVPIVGMGGLGKTTLARKLFNKPAVRNHFHASAFCYVGQDHNKRRLLLEILTQIIVIGDDNDDATDYELAHKLRKCLKGKRYLIIMDDIWDVGPWFAVKDSFPEDRKGSRIVFTTRISDVPRKVDSHCKPHYLRFLSTEESWELLQAKVFDKHPCPPHLQEVGLLIAEKCNGLALAVVVIAGLLSRKPETWTSWNKIADDIGTHAATEGCMYTLELSYMHLPDNLKSCLLYFGAFLKKKNISAKRLRLLWAAEGFLPKSSSNDYLEDLVQRSLVIVHQRSSTGGIKRCEVHDLVRELCRMKAREERFFYFLERSSVLSLRDVYKQYRLCIHLKLETEEINNAEAERSLSSAHTVIYYCPDSPCFMDALPFSDVKLVQVLDVKAECDTFPEEVAMLVNLRYLTLKTHALSSVPSTIANLWNLETFVLKCFSERKMCLPKTIWKMKRLKHVDVGQEAIVELDNDVGKDSSKLPNISSFSSVTITYGESGVELLRRLSNVRKLSCCYYTCLDWEDKFRELPNLDEYLTKLESLNIVSDGPFYPSVSWLPKTLKKLSLKGVNLPWTKFDAIVYLPRLESLKLMKNSFRGEEWNLEDVEFPNLKFLKLYGLDVEKWVAASIYTFPSLEQIVVKSCNKLIGLPSNIGEVQTLTFIDVYDCQQGVGESALQILDEQREMGNDIIQVQVIKEEE